jgi:2-amino-4-hydroxy-6-hydroxymethyldihydropteridine diphosphokinase
LWIDGRVVSTPELRVPHPELARRAFALVPLLDVAPDALDPVSGRSYADVASEIDREGVQRIADPAWSTL